MDVPGQPLKGRVTLNQGGDFQTVRDCIVRQFGPGCGFPDPVWLEEEQTIPWKSGFGFCPAFFEACFDEGVNCEWHVNP